MTHLSPEKYSIAWFKLAELVSRREKERALSIFRLLSHSLADQAYTLLLEAEVLHAFQDMKAGELFLKAAHKYMQQKRFEMAFMIYSMVSMEHEHIDISTPLLELCHEVPNKKLVEHFCSRLFLKLSILGKADTALHCALSVTCAPALKAEWIDSIIGYAKEHYDEFDYQQLLDRYAHSGKNWAQDVSVLSKTLRELAQ